jgi:hypothetical protein
MGKAAAQTVVLDAGALIALESGDPRMRALCREAVAGRARLVLPATVVAQVFRDRAKQVMSLGVLLKSPQSTVVDLDQPLAEAAGILCGRTNTRDIVDASVVLIARRERAPVVTSDFADLRRLDPTLRLERI